MKNWLINWSIFILLSIIWGSSFRLMKIGMEELSPYQVAAIRMLSAGVVLLPFTIKAIRNIDRSKINIVLLSGLLGSFFPAFLFCIAETRIDSSLAGILNALTPLFTILIGVLFFKMKVSVQRYIGVIVGFIGLALLFISRGNITLGYLYFAFLVLLATIFYGINVNIVSRNLKNTASMDIAALAFTFLIPPSLLVLYITGYFSKPTTYAFWHATGASTILGVFGTALASVFFYVLVKRAGGLFASTVTYGIPFVAVFWGILGGEVITPVQVMCLGIILLGVYLANRVSKEKIPVQAASGTSVSK
ncbi:DMT family transporter [Aridibaculum aurantiacum]|uniref:DMT family transporter n=1 Tax=Aridibaculum aurantiacum TaxID=2810307 RepID=UPI001A95FB86|nr:DMT family transporter [Aridibaculum aurantiacum]